ncbi:MAG: acyl-CoA thioesterase [Flavobacteriaceae bacterium]
MHRFKQVFEVTMDDLDDLNHVNNIRYMEWIQEISKKHWLEVTGNDLQNNMVWVVKNHNIDYKKPAILGDIIEVSTYIQKTSGPLSTRVVEIINNKTSQLIVKACTEWCLLDAKTLKPKRVPQNIQNLFGKT